VAKHVHAFTDFGAYFGRFSNIEVWCLFVLLLREAIIGYFSAKCCFTYFLQTSLDNRINSLSYTLKCDIYVTFEIDEIRLDLHMQQPCGINKRIFIDQNFTYFF